MKIFENVNTLLKNSQPILIRRFHLNLKLNITFSLHTRIHLVYTLHFSNEIYKIKYYIHIIFIGKKFQKMIIIMITYSTPPSPLNAIEILL